jgi:hypothetical protein
MDKELIEKIETLIREVHMTNNFLNKILEIIKEEKR